MASTPAAPMLDAAPDLLPALAGLTRHHRQACPPYDRILTAIGVPRRPDWTSVEELPWLPVGLFKHHALKSVPDSEVFRVLTSSGTTGAAPSRIHLDRETAAAQSRALGAALRPVLGTKRLPMLIVDSPATAGSSSARGAGVIGMATFGRDHAYALDGAGAPDLAALRGFLARHGGERFLIFGFTFMVWAYLYEPAAEHRLDLSNGVLIHSGGWKRLAERAVDNATLRRRFAEDTGLSRIHNYYGMVEQLGSVFVEGPSGDGLYCPEGAGIVIRDPVTWEPQPTGRAGLVEVVSVLPRSYPGHLLLTDDLGVVDGIDDGDWPGPRFRVLGRLPRAEPRGCSDVAPGLPGAPPRSASSPGSGAPAMRQAFPAGGGVGVPALLDDLAAAGLSPGDPRIVDFLAAFARRLLAPAGVRRFPELASLGFFLRRGEIARALERLRESPAGLRAPRGLVFHVPPANVDTIFVYSWAISALAGNRNVVRISPRAGGAAERALEALNEALADADPVVARTQRMVVYGHDESVTAALSAACDLRVIWGGDAAVAAIRSHPLGPGARDLTFPDRTSFAVISAAGWHRASAAARREAARGLFNDTYWFDQAACASPRAIYWVGEAAGAGAASDELFALLREVVDEHHTTTEPAMALHKRLAAYGAAADGLVRTIRQDGNEIAVWELADPHRRPEGWLGAGSFPQALLPSLAAVAAVVERRDQTCTAFGFSNGELRSFQAAVAGRGIDRIVPFGSALSFAAVWDGYDLLAEFTRLTSLQTPRPPGGADLIC